MPSAAGRAASGLRGTALFHRRATSTWLAQAWPGDGLPRPATYASLVVIVRRAGPGDVDALRAIAAAAYQKYVPRIGRLPAPMTADYAQAVRDQQAWAAIDDGRVVGFTVLSAKPDYLLLENVAVLPAAQGRGIGALLLAAAEDRARSLGLSQIRLYTNEAMTENLAYYPRHGYAETHRAEQDGYHRVFFRKIVS
jgi:GNAT superfamily N-acetyltransferase